MFSLKTCLEILNCEIFGEGTPLIGQYCTLDDGVADMLSNTSGSVQHVSTLFHIPISTFHTPASGT